LVAKKDEALFTSASSRPNRATTASTSGDRAATSSRSAVNTAALPGRRRFRLAARSSASAREARQWMATIAPAACSVRAISAPTRRAAPVTSMTGAEGALMREV
jgi:hypothetical protein